MTVKQRLSRSNITMFLIPLLIAALLKASLEEEQRRQQSRKELIAGMSHDLKSSLTSIRAYTEALMEGVAAERKGYEPCHRGPAHGGRRAAQHNGPRQGADAYEQRV